MINRPFTVVYTYPPCRGAKKPTDAFIFFDVKENFLPTGFYRIGEPAPALGFIGLKAVWNWLNKQMPEARLQPRRFQKESLHQSQETKALRLNPDHP